MKIAKIILSLTAIIFAVLGIKEVISFNIANPITLVSMATVILLSGIEFKTNNDKKAFILMLIISLFAYAFVIYTIFFR